MRAIKASEFKARCLAILDGVARTGDPVAIPKRGRIVAEVVRPRPIEAARYPQDALRGTGKTLGDIIAPAMPAEARANVADVLVQDAFCRPDPCKDAVPSQGCKVNGVPDQPCQGTDGDDVILGTAGGDGSGDDDLDGGPGDDRLRGGGHVDRLRGGSGADRLDGGGAADLCTDADQLGPFVRCE